MNGAELLVAALENKGVRSKPRSRAAGCIWCRRRSTIPRMSGSWSTNCAIDKQAASISTDGRRVP